MRFISSDNLSAVLVLASCLQTYTFWVSLCICCTYISLNKHIRPRLTYCDPSSLQVDPLDAGTDNGLTFTSPNWPTSPAERIFRITSSYPDHPAHSFYYPTLSHLPRIATFTITKVTTCATLCFFAIIGLLPLPLLSL